MAWAISGLARMHSFSFLQYFYSVHVPSQSSLKLHLAMSSFLNLFLETPPQIEFPSFSLYNPSHFSLFRITLSPWLTVRTSCFTWIRHLSSSSTSMDIRLYRASGTYWTASRACIVISLYVTLIVPMPMTSQVKLSTILTVHSSFASKKLNSSF